MKTILTLAAALTVAAATTVMAQHNHGHDHSGHSHAGHDHAHDHGPMATLGHEAPDFTLTDANGDEHSLSDFAGKWVVLEWVNFDCPFVKKHYGAGNMQNLQATFTDKDVVWLGICSSAPGKQGYFEGKALRDRIEKEKYEATAYLVDPTGMVGKMYAAKTTPHMYVINPEGMLLYAGAIDDKPSPRPKDIEGAHNYVHATLTAAMAGETVEPKATRAYGCSVKYAK